MARATLREIFPNSIRLQPDESGKFLWAVFVDGFVDDFYVTRLALLYDTHEARRDADTAATLAAFTRAAEASVRVENNGSGGGGI